MQVYGRRMEPAEHPLHAAGGVDPFEGMTDEQVLARAAKALRRVNRLAMGSTERAIQWAVFEAAKAELDLRMARHILAKLQERRERG